MNKKDIIRSSILALGALVIFAIALCASYVSGRESGLVAPGVQVIECLADVPADGDPEAFQAA